MDPTVVALMGLPGCGKSTLAGSLHRRLGLWEVNRDRIRRAMFPQCRFTAAEKEAANRAVWEAVMANCRLGRSSVVDGMSFARRSEVERAREIAVSCGFRFAAVLLDCPVAVAQARIAADPASACHPAGDRDAGLVEEVAARFEPPRADALRVDATADAQAVGEAVLALLAARRD